MAALPRQISVTSNLRPAKGSEVGVRPQPGSELLILEPDPPVARDLQSQILQNSEIGDFYMHYDMKECGNRIRELRTQLGYTQEELAKELSINRSYLSRVESGKKGSSVDLLIQLSEFFHVSLDFIVMGKNSATSEPLLKDEISALIDHLYLFQASLESDCV